MDFSKLKTNDWLKVGGAAGMLIFGFFKWAKFEFIGANTFNNVFDYPIRGLIPWILVVGVGVVTLLGTQGKTIGNVKWPIISVLATGIATVLMLLLALFFPDREFVDYGEQVTITLEPALGLWLAFISTIVSFVGSLLAFTSGGGNLKDLTDVKKLKESFGQGGN